MSSFTAVSDPGAYFATQIARNELDPFAVLGLHADIDELSMRGARSHYRTVVMPHVFEAPGKPRTIGPRVPTWSQVNDAKKELLDGSQSDFKALKTAWKHRSVQVWNPFAPVGSDAAKLSRSSRSCMQSPSI